MICTVYTGIAAKVSPGLYAGRDERQKRGFNMPKKALIIEDDANIRELLRLYLEKDGFEVFGVSDGSNGLREYKRINPDLILLDIMLPVMDGWQVCREIRR